MPSPSGDPPQDAPIPAAPPQGLRSMMMRGSAGAFGLRALAAILTFAVTLLLARFLGATEFGYYAWALSWMTILRLVVTLGYDNLLVRETVVLAPDSNWLQLRALIRRCNQTIIGVSFVVLPLTAGLGALIARPGTSQFAALAVGLLGLPVVSLMTMRQAVIQGLSRVIIARIPEDLLYPGALLLLVAGVRVVFPGRLDATTATGLRVVSLALALGLAVLLVRRYIPKKLGSAAAHAYALKRLAASSVPLVVIGTANVFIVEIGTIVVGAVVGSAAAGGYAIAVKLAFTLSLIEAAANQALAPIVVNLHAGGDRRRLQAALTKSARAVVGLAAAGGLVIVVFAAPVLNFVGSDYSGFGDVLRVLVIGWLLNLLGGPCALLLVMAGHERDAATAVVGAALLSGPLTLGLTYAFGSVGAAFAMSATVVMWNAILVWRCWTLWRLDTTALGALAAMKRHQK